MNNQNKDKDPLYNLFESFNEEKPSADFTRKTMNAVFAEWSKSPETASRFGFTDYLWPLAIGAALIIAITLYPEQLGLGSDGVITDILLSMTGYVEKLLSSVSPSVWAIITAGFMLLFFDNMMKIARKI